MIDFNVPPYIGTELDEIRKAVLDHRICGDGPFTANCSSWLEDRFHARKVLLTTSGSTALDMAVLLCGLKEGDEVILPSFTFSSTANAVILAGAVPVFVDIRPDTMNIDEQKIEAAITERTKAIIAVHYAGVSCEMDTIMKIAQEHHLYVIEDAAQAVMSSYKGNALGTIGTFGCYSFHETKNYSMGEGGALLINDPSFIEAAEIMREKGTNRAKFYRGQIDKYTWVEFGGSYLPSELNAAYLYAQLKEADRINADRLASWNAYDAAFRPYEARGLISLPHIPEGCVHNAHMYYLKLADLDERTAFIRFMAEQGVQTVFHYIPLHSAPAGLKYGRFHGEDCYTTSESERLVRLPMYYGLKREDRDHVIQSVIGYLEKK